MIIYLDLDGKETSVAVTNKSTFRSKHTGRELKCVEVSLVAKSKQAHEKLLGFIKSGSNKHINSTDGEGVVTNKWKIKNNSYSYSDDSYNSNYHHFIELEEIEEIEVTSLIVGELELHPYFYKEEFDEDALIIEAKVMISKSQYSDLKEVMKKVGYFPVIRQGINEEQREMRFGLTRWSEHEESIKHELLLVDKIYDDKQKGFPRSFNLTMDRMQDKIAEDSEILTELISTLINKGLLSIEECDHLRAQALQRVWDKIRDFYQMKDIDEI